MSAFYGVLCLFFSTSHFFFSVVIQGTRIVTYISLVVVALAFAVVKVATIYCIHIYRWDSAFPSVILLFVLAF